MTELRRKGILPIILEELIAARERVDAELEEELDSSQRLLLNGRKLALEVRSPGFSCHLLTHTNSYTRF